jgi:hypothetical protein
MTASQGAKVEEKALNLSRSTHKISIIPTQQGIRRESVHTVGGTNNVEEEWAMP